MSSDFDAGEPKAEGKAPAPQSATEKATGDTITIDGKAYPVDEVLEWRNMGLRQADYSKKTMAFGEERREYERQIAERDARIKELQSEGLTKRQATVKEAGEYAQMNEYVPGLGEFAQKMETAILSISQRQEAAETKAREYEVSESRDEAMDKALRAYEGKPYANLEEMRQFLEARGLGPKDADLAYEGLYAFQRGAAAKEAEMMKRGALAPSTMAPSRVGIQASSAEEVARVRPSTKPIRETSFQEIRDRALADPRRPRATE